MHHFGCTWRVVMEASCGCASSKITGNDQACVFFVYLRGYKLRDTVTMPKPRTGFYLEIEGFEEEKCDELGLTHRIYLRDSGQTKIGAAQMGGKGNHPHLSTKMAIIEQNEQLIFITVCPEATNPVQINGRPLPAGEKNELKAGDIVCFAHVDFSGPFYFIDGKEMHGTFRSVYNYKVMCDTGYEIECKQCFQRINIGQTSRCNVCKKEGRELDLKFVLKREPPEQAAKKKKIT